MVTPLDAYAARIHSHQVQHLPTTSSGAPYIYLDSAAVPPVPRPLIDAVYAHIARDLYGNPHSHHPSANTAADAIQQARASVLSDVFDVDSDEWSLVFTSGATQGLKLVAESFNFGHHHAGTFAHLLEAHTSVAGMKASALSRGLGDGGCSSASAMEADELLRMVQRQDETAKRQSEPCSSRERRPWTQPASSEPCRACQRRSGLAVSPSASSASLSASSIDSRSRSPSLGTSSRPTSSEGGGHDFGHTAFEPSADVSPANLVVVPLQCNATGQRYHSLISALESARKQPAIVNSACTCHLPTYILLDASSYLSPSTRLPLAGVKADMVVFSFAKLFGHPTGLGGLLLRRSSVDLARLSRKAYYGGGTLSLALPLSGHSRPSPDLVRALEDGSPNTHAIIALPHASRVLHHLLSCWEERQVYVHDLTRRLFAIASEVNHANGRPVLRVYTRSEEGQAWLRGSPPPSTQDQGPILLFNVLAPSGVPLAPSEVSRLAILRNIHLRSGRHCAPGVMLSQLGVTESTMTHIWRLGGVCGGEREEGSWGPDAEQQGPAAALRVSLSVWNTREDLDIFKDFIVRFFAQPEASPIEASPLAEPEQPAARPAYTVHTLSLYPIKSAHAQDVPPGQSWALRPTGLAYDREWCIVSLASPHATAEPRSRGSKPRPAPLSVLSQKRYPKMARIRPRVDEVQGFLKVWLTRDDELDGHAVGLECGLRLVPEHVREPDFAVPLHVSAGDLCGLQVSSAGCVDVRVCGDLVAPLLEQRADVRELLSEFLGLPCTLARFGGQAAADLLKSASTSGQSGRAGRFSKLPFGASALAAHTGTPNPVPIALSNESPFLICSLDSVRQVAQWLRRDAAGVEEDESGSSSESEASLLRLAARFRPNIIIAPTAQPAASTPHSGADGAATLPEDGITRLLLGEQLFTVLAPCRRCEMVALDADSGARRSETLLSVARRRRLGGRVLFGLHAEWRRGLGVGAGAEEALPNERIAVGMVVRPRS